MIKTCPNQILPTHLLFHNKIKIPRNDFGMRLFLTNEFASIKYPNDGSLGWTEAGMLPVLMDLELACNVKTCEVRFAYLALIITYNNHKRVKALVC